MTVLQLIARDRPEGLEELSVVPNPSESRPESFESAVVHPKLIGSQDLVILGAGLCRQGYRAIDAVFTDRFFTRIWGDDIEELRDELLVLMNTAHLDDIEKFLSQELAGIYVESVKLLDSTKRGTVSFRQEGIVITSPAVGTEALAKSVQLAHDWAEAS